VLAWTKQANFILRRQKMVFLRLLLVTLSMCVSVMAAASPLSGTWKFNPAKGHPASPPPKSIVAHVEVDQENFKFVQEGFDDKGQPFKESYEAKFDGKDYPVSGDPYSDSVSLHRINERKVEFTLKKGGKVVAKFTDTVSKDGKNTMITFIDLSTGQPQNDTVVYDKE
jgi:hypothetical protein